MDAAPAFFGNQPHFLLNCKIGFAGIN